MGDEKWTKKTLCSYISVFGVFNSNKKITSALSIWHHFSHLGGPVFNNSGRQEKGPVSGISISQKVCTITY